MATDAKQATKEPGAGAHAAAPASDAATVVVETGKRKRKTSRGLKDAQRWERGLAKAGRRLGRAVSKGLDTYYDRREASSFKRRDGAVRDALKNWSKAAGKALRKASDAPSDLFKGIDSKSVRRTVKFAVRSMTLPFLR